jgi:hypothetical protein
MSMATNELELTPSMNRLISDVIEKSISPSCGPDAATTQPPQQPSTPYNKSLPYCWWAANLRTKTAGSVMTLQTRSRIPLTTTPSNRKGSRMSHTIG